MLEAYEEYYEVAQTALRAGATAHDVHRAVSRGFTERGYHLGHVTGHSIGMTMIEHPRIGEGIDTVLEANMVFSMHPHAISRGRARVPLHAGHVARHRGRRRAARRAADEDLLTWHVSPHSPPLSSLSGALAAGAVAVAASSPPVDALARSGSTSRPLPTLSLFAGKPRRDCRPDALDETGRGPKLRSLTLLVVPKREPLPNDLLRECADPSTRSFPDQFPPASTRRQGFGPTWRRTRPTAARTRPRAGRSSSRQGSAGVSRDRLPVGQGQSHPRVDVSPAEGGPVPAATWGSSCSRAASTRSVS